VSVHYDAVIDAAGKFQMVGMKAGQYGSNFQKAGPTWFPSATESEAAEHITVRGGDDLSGYENLEAGSPPIRIVYKPNAGTVSGSVESGNGASVVLISQAALDSLAVEAGRISPSGAGGAVEIEGVAPGSYYAFAVDRLEADKFHDPRIVRKILSSAALVQVTERVGRISQG
jgi:hypothetical protein